MEVRERTCRHSIALDLAAGADIGPRIPYTPAQRAAPSDTSVQGVRVALRTGRRRRTTADQHNDRGRFAERGQRLQRTIARCHAADQIHHAG